jgi:hypothetical protein
MVTTGPGELLLGRRSEIGELERLLAAVRGGRSGVLVVRGEPCVVGGAGYWWCVGSRAWAKPR